MTTQSATDWHWLSTFVECGDYLVSLLPLSAVGALAYCSFWPICIVNYLPC